MPSTQPSILISAEAAITATANMSGTAGSSKAFLEELKKEFPKLTFHEVDYGPLTRAVVSAEFFGSKRIPLKACVGAVAPPRRLDMPFPAWQFSTVSTRIFLLDVARFRERVQALPVIPPALHLRLKALRHGNPPQAIPAEAILSTVLRQHGLHRVDMLGSGSGMWSLHPTSRTTTFFQGLPDLIARVEAGDIPDAQRGEFDVHDVLAN
jgi:hypothetical protein